MTVLFRDENLDALGLSGFSVGCSSCHLRVKLAYFLHNTNKTGDFLLAIVLPCNNYAMKY